MNLNLNGLNVYEPLFHLDLIIIFTMKEIFLKCRISMLFSLLDVKKRNKRSHSKRKNGNFKRKHKTVLSLFDLNILLNSGRHQMLFKLASLSVSSLRKLDYVANKLYDRKHDLYVLFVLRFYGPVNPVGSCRARSVYLTTHLLGRLSPLCG